MQRSLDLVVSSALFSVFVEHLEFWIAIQAHNSLKTVHSDFKLVNFDSSDSNFNKPIIELNVKRKNAGAIRPVDGPPVAVLGTDTLLIALFYGNVDRDVNRKNDVCQGMKVGVRSERKEKRLDQESEILKKLFCEKVRIDGYRVDWKIGVIVGED
ncbi:hypothetical protein ROZALSC1DRAFT_20779 [Rozella allomycis CSF55]|uniref:Uncharacterized protein n=1 Tax=Rozella allomycis (strain CSF55) TaxID=988480 RepID=A0A4P9YPE1_ROZAC|nr:hypothetical protein ROZALSC1DRAFT_20779 [Rozella allomycis CSF55]